MARPKGKFAKLVKSKTDSRWYVRYPHPDKIGKNKTETFRTETEAIDRRDSLNALHEAERKKQLKAEKWTVKTVLDIWVKEVANGLASSVKEVPRAEYISKVIGAVRVADLTKEHYRMLLEHIKNDKTRRTKSERGFEAYFVTLRTALNHSKDEIKTFPKFKGFIKGNYEPRDRVLTRDELQELIDACYVEKGGRDRQHLAAIITWLHETACRSGELKTIRVNDIDLEASIVKIRQSKRKVGTNPKPRNCGISPKLAEMIIESNLLDYPPDTFVIAEPLGFDTPPDFKRSFATACRIAKAQRVENERNGDCFDDLHIHDLRTTGITNMLERGLSLPLVASMVGHEAESVMTLKVYTKFRQKFIAEEMQKLA
jgi:integrase